MMDNLDLMHKRLKNKNIQQDSTIATNNLDLMHKRINGGNTQQERMIADKVASLKSAIKSSYQGAQVRIIGASQVAGALINPNALKPDYDEKTISIPFDAGYGVGTTFEWLNTNTKWLIYLQDLTELAYFHGDARKCNYEIKWQHNDVLYTTYAALTGPSEKKLDSTSAGHANLDVPNYSLHFYIPYTVEAEQYFDRYCKFYLQGLPTCWRIEAIDKISLPGIIEIYANEYYSNEHEDDVEQGLVGTLIVDPISPEDEDNKHPAILGDSVIKPKTTHIYTYEGVEDGEWLINSDSPIVAIPNNNQITIKWDTIYSGSFELTFGEAKKVVIVEPLL